MKRKNQLEKQIAMDLGYAVLSHYIHEEEKDYYDKAYHHIKDCNITSIKYVKHLFKPNEIIITCVRPGYLIGKKGIIWNRVNSEFKKECNSKIRNAELIIKEDKINDSLYSFMAGMEFE